MFKLATYLTNLTTGNPGFSQDQYKDDTGSGDGTGAVAQSINDIFYAIIAPIKKYKGDISDAAESETASDMLETLEIMSGVASPTVSVWASGTTYAADDNVFYLGVQFVSMINGNLNQDPFTYPEKWRPADDRNWLLARFADAKSVDSGFAPLHDYRDSAYRQHFGMGIHNYGGFTGTGGSGRDLSFTGVHLDGTVITGDATLVALFDVGGANEYPYLDIIAPDVAGTRTIIDARGTFKRYVDAVAGLTGDVGSVGLENLPNIEGSFVILDGDSQGILINSDGAFDIGFSSLSVTTTMDLTSATTKVPRQVTIDASTYNSTYSTKDSVEPANIVEGLPFIIVMNDA